MNFVKYLAVTLFLSSSAHAFFSVSESAELVAPNTFQVGVEPQLLTGDNRGGNLNVFLDGAIDDATSGRLSIGSGTVDLNAFASAKWVPFPDVNNQPAMGLRAGVGIARVDEHNMLQLQFAPLASKKYETAQGLAVPYISVPFTYYTTKSDSFIGANMAIGSEFHYREWKNVTLGGELGIDLSKSWSYISVFAAFSFDAPKGGN